jgi:hypothetical protein
MTIRLEPDRFGVRTKIDVHDRLLSITLHFRYRPIAAGRAFAERPFASRSRAVEAAVRYVAVILAARAAGLGNCLSSQTK